MPYKMFMQREFLVYFLLQILRRACVFEKNGG